MLHVTCNTLYVLQILFRERVQQLISYFVYKYRYKMVPIAEPTKMHLYLLGYFYRIISITN